MRQETHLSRWDLCLAKINKAYILPIMNKQAAYEKMINFLGHCSSLALWEYPVFQVSIEKQTEIQTSTLLYCVVDYM